MSARLSDSLTFGRPRSSKKGPPVERSGLSSRSELPLSITPIQELTRADLNTLRVDFPEAHEALCQYDRLLQNTEDRYRAKEAELHRCINVGQELLGQIDQLKERCKTLLQEREALAELHVDASTKGSAKSLEKERKFWLKQQKEWEKRQEKLFEEINLAKEMAREKDDHLREESHRFTVAQRRQETEIRQLKDEIADLQLEVQQRNYELRQEKGKGRGLNDSGVEGQSTISPESFALVQRPSQYVPAPVDLVATTRLTVTVINQLLQLQEDMQEVSLGISMEAPSITRLRAPDAQGDGSQSFYLEWLMEALQKESSLVSEVFEKWSERKFEARQVQQNYVLLKQQKEEVEKDREKIKHRVAEVEQFLQRSKEDVKRLTEALEKEKEMGSKRVEEDVAQLQAKAKEIEKEKTALEQRLSTERKEAQLERSVIVNEARVEIEKLQRAVRRAEEEKDILEKKTTRAETGEDGGPSKEVLRCRNELESLEEEFSREKQQSAAVRRELEEWKRKCALLESTSHEQLQKVLLETERTVRRLKEENQNLRDSLLKTQKESLSEIDQIHRSKTELMKENQNLRDQIHNVSGETLPELEKENKDLRRRFAGVQEALEAAQQELTVKDEILQKLKEKLESVELNQSDRLSVMDRLETSEKRLKSELATVQEALRQRGVELEEVRGSLLTASDTVKSLSLQNKALNERLKKVAEEKGSVEEQKEHRLASLLSENQQLVADRVQFYESFRLLEEKCQQLTVQLQAARDDLDRAETRKRKVERLLVEAPSSTSAWDAVCAALRAGVTLLQERASVEAGEKIQSCNRILEQLLARVSAYVEAESEKQSRAWETVRKRILSDYSLSESPRLSQSTDVPSEEPVQSTEENIAALQVESSLLGLLDVLKQMESEEAGGRKTLEEKEIAAQQAEDAKRHILRLEADLRTAKDAVVSSNETAELLRSEVERLQTRSEGLQQELNMLNQMYKESAKAAHKIEETLLSKAREREAEKIRYQATIEELNARLGEREANLNNEYLKQRRDAEKRERMLQDTVQSLEFKVKELEMDRKLLSQREKQLKMDCEESRTEVETLKKALELLREETLHLQETVERKDMDGSVLRDRQMEEINQLKKRLERCLSEKQQQLHQSRKEADLLRAALEECKNELQYVEKRLTSTQLEYAQLEKSHKADHNELEALRRVNHSLEVRLAEVESDRDPLRQQLHSVLITQPGK